MSDVTIRRAEDMASENKTIVLHWGLPATAMVIAIFLSHPPKTLVWIAALIWMGVSCLINARCCGRTHCYYTGPFFLVVTIPVLLHGYQFLWLGPEGWKWLGVTIGVGGGGLWCLTEKILGRYSSKN